MKKILFLLFPVIILILANCSTIPEYTETLKDKSAVNILMLMNDNFGLNYMLMLDAMELKGWKLTHIGTSGEVRPCLGFASAEMPGFNPDYNLSEFDGGRDFNTAGFDALVTCPGTGSFAPIKNPFGDVLDNPATMEFITGTFNTGMPLFSMCMGVIIPLEAGLLEGRKVTGSSRLKQRIMMAGGEFMGRDYPPVISGNLVTAVRGQYYNYHNMTAVALAMENGSGNSGVITAEPAGWTLSSAPVISEKISSSTHPTPWEKYLTGSPVPDGARDGTVLEDGSLFICGYSFGRRTENAEGVVLRVSADGSLLWSTYIGGPGSEYLNAAAHHKGIFYAAGHTTSEGAGSRDALAAAFDNNGELLWYRTYGGGAQEEIMDMIITAEGPLLFGHSASDSAGEEDLMLLQLDFNGNLLREQRYGGKRSEIAGGLMPFGDGYALSGSSGSFNKNTDFHLIFTDERGSVVDECHYAGKGSRVEGFDWATEIFPSADGNPVLVGYADARSPMGARLIGTDEDGEELFNIGYKDGDFYNYGYDGFSANGSLYVLGTRRDRDYDSKIFLIRTDEDGKEQEHMTFDSPERDWAVSCGYNPDGAAVFFGQSGRAEKMETLTC